MHKNNRGADLKLRLGFVNFDELPDIPIDQQYIIAAIIKEEMRKTCSHARPVVPLEPMQEQVSIGNGDGSNGDISNRDEDLNAHQSHNACQTVANLQRNLQKIDEGTFGLCDNEDCQEPIGAARMFNSRFGATHCLGCQSKREKNRTRGPGRVRTVA